jgi:hypothetical protein
MVPESSKRIRGTMARRDVEGSLQMLGEYSVHALMLRLYQAPIGPLMVSAVMLASGGCGSVQAGRARGARKIEQALRRQGYVRVREKQNRENGSLTFPFEPQYGRVVVDYTMKGLTILVVRANASTIRLDDPAIYWFRAGDILIGVPEPPLNNTRAAQFSAATDALK